jgi:hypothetical protein
VPVGGGQRHVLAIWSEHVIIVEVRDAVHTSYEGGVRNFIGSNLRPSRTCSPVPRHLGQ